MTAWRAMVEANNEYGRKFDFKPPATDAQIQDAEDLLGVTLPTGIKSLLREFNGVWDATNSTHPEITYLDTQHMSVEVPNYFRMCSDPIQGNPIPPEEDLQKVVFFYQSNGFGDLWGICLEDVAESQAGEIVRLDHEEGDLVPSYSSLEEFVVKGPW